MLKLVRKPPPPTDGPHAFSELFSTVVVENNEAGNGRNGTLPHVFLMHQLLLYFVLILENLWLLVQFWIVLKVSDLLFQTISEKILFQNSHFQTHTKVVYLLLEMWFFSQIFIDLLEAFPWLASEKSTRREEVEELGEEEDGGLPAHLEVDPQEKLEIKNRIEIMTLLATSHLSHVEIRWLFLIRRWRRWPVFLWMYFISLPGAFPWSRWQGTGQLILPTLRMGIPLKLGI